MIRAKHFIYPCLLWLFSCSSESDLQDQSVLGSISRIDSTLFNQKLQSYSKKTILNTNDLLWGEFITAPDSVYKYITEKSTKYEVLKLLSEKKFKVLNEWLRLVDDHGLDSNYYHAKKIQEFQAWPQLNSYKGRPLDLDTLAVFSILCADAVYTSIHDVCIGRSSPEYSGTANSLIKRKLKSDFKDVLANFGIENYREWIPHSDDYKKNQERLRLYRSIPKTAFLKHKGTVQYPTDSISMVDIYARLCLVKGNHFSDAFLRRPNMRALNALMASINFQIDSSKEFWNERIRNMISFNHNDLGQKLALNLDRWRWMDSRSKGTYVWVNIARNELDAFRNDTLVLSMKVCTGRRRNSAYFKSIISYHRKDSGSFRPQNHETPCLKSRITYFVVLPTWKVPKSILFNELIGKIRRNPGYINRMGYTLKTFSGKQVDPYSVNWNEITLSNIQYYLEEPSGPKNSLGTLKAIFHNPYSVYCHDTPNKWAFLQLNRHVSHGCVRLHSPYDFINYLVSIQDENSMDYVDMALGNAPRRDTSLMRLQIEEQNDTNIIVKKYGKKNNLKFSLKKSVPIHLVYLTAEIDHYGLLRIYEDGYGRDKMLAATFINPLAMHYEEML
jgi:hypothetical protein